MSRRQAQIGFSQRIRLEWFEQTARLIVAGNDRAKINDALQDLLRERVSVGGASVRGNREKVITILLRTWLTVPRHREKLRDDGLRIFQRLPPKERIAVHWGMILAAYPFWGAVAAHTGRLLRLQGTAAAAQVQRRVREQYGERETVSRAARRVLRAFIDWAVLNETQDQGVYEQGKQHPVEDPGLIAWMVEASLYSHSNGSAAIRDLLAGPSIFPFRLAHVSSERLASVSPRLEILPYGLGDDLVVLRRECPPGP